MSNPSAQERNTRLGILLFLIYAAFYLGFVLVNAFAPQWGDWEPVEGLNLAVLWGFSLIGLAFLLSLLYGTLCTSDSAGQTESKETEH